MYYSLQVMRTAEIVDGAIYSQHDTMLWSTFGILLPLVGARVQKQYPDSWAKSSHTAL